MAVTLQATQVTVPKTDFIDTTYRVKKEKENISVSKLHLLPVAKRLKYLKET
jgi:hypothetical protein